MLTAIRRVRSYTDGFTFYAFCSDQRTIDAVIRNFEVIGEAARHVDEATAVRSGVAVRPSRTFGRKWSISRSNALIARSRSEPGSMPF